MDILEDILNRARQWDDLTKGEKLAFASKVRETGVRGWLELQRVAEEFGFEADEDMPSIYELEHWQ